MAMFPFPAGSSASSGSATSVGSAAFPLLAPAGTNAAPSYAFSGSAGTGMYSGGTDILSFSRAGAEVFRLSNALTIAGAAASVGLVAAANTDFKFATASSNTRIVLQGHLDADHTLADVIFCSANVRTDGYVCAANDPSGVALSNMLWGVSFEGATRQKAASGALTTAPAAGYMLLRVLPGTNAGTLKLTAYAGTSTTGATVIDNVGAGN